MARVPQKVVEVPVKLVAFADMATERRTDVWRPRSRRTCPGESIHRGRGVRLLGVALHFSFARGTPELIRAA